MRRARLFLNYRVFVDSTTLFQSFPKTSFEMCFFYPQTIPEQLATQYASLLQDSLVAKQIVQLFRIGIAFIIIGCGLVVFSFDYLTGAFSIALGAVLVDTFQMDRGSVIARCDPRRGTQNCYSVDSAVPLNFTTLVVACCCMDGYSSTHYWHICPSESRRRFFVVLCRHCLGFACDCYRVHWFTIGAIMENVSPQCSRHATPTR